MAEVMKYNDFKEEGSEVAAKVCVFLYSLIIMISLNRRTVDFLRNVLEYNFNASFFSQAAGKYRQQGRNYMVEDGDIIFFKFNTPNAPKKKP